jgi:hypothetical protein
MKKVIFLVIFTTASFCVRAQLTIIDRGTCGNSLTWVLTGDSTLTISGSDTMPDYYSWSGGTPWDAYKNDITSVVIGDNVTTIGRAAFRDCINLTAVTIPNSITSIGANAFSRCFNLTSITIPNSVTSIGGSAFESCRNLTSVTIPDSVTSIGSHAFGGCRNLTSVTISNSVTSIGNGAFVWCYNLISVTLSNSFTSIEDVTFAWCTSLTSITIPNSVMAIKGNAFAGCSSLASVTIPNSVTAIGQWAFSGCSGLRAITVHATTPPAILFNIENQVFRDVPDTIPVYIPCGTYNDYSTASGWDYFSNFIDPITKDTSFYTATLSQGETYSDNNFTNLAEAGRYCITLQNVNDCDSVVCLNLRYETGMADIHNYMSLQIYPNPTVGQLIIDNGELMINNVELFDAYGKSVLRQGKQSGAIQKIDISHLANGIYLLKINNNIVKKIIKY